jgi:hypothetical protein
MASPMIAGCVANIYEKHPNLTAKQVQAKLQTNPRQPAGWVADADGPGVLAGGQVT